MIRRRSFPYRNNNSGGILEFLYKTYNSNYSNLVKTYASSVKNTDIKSDGIIDFNDSYWICQTSKLAGEYAIINLPFHIIDVIGYTIQTSNAGVDGCHPKQWSMSSSNNVFFWQNEIETLDNEGVMNGPRNWMYVPYRKGKNDSFKITVTGQSYCGSANGIRMDVNQIEFYGTLYSKEYFFDHKTCNCRHSSITSFLFIHILVLSS